MTTVRKIASLFTSVPTIEGAGVHLKRVFGHGELPRFDPFLMMDDFHSSDPSRYLAGFPWHPHRGIETITYLLEGIVEHGDSMGNRGTIGSGDVQWMTAGSGVIHQEMPKVSPSGTMWGFQFWANLPAAHKMMPPRYQDIKAADIPVVTREDGTAVKIICGEFEGVRGPVTEIVIDPVLMDISIPAGTVFSIPVTEGYTALAYLLTGSADFDRSGRVPHAEQVVLYEHSGDRISVETSETPVRFLFLSGRPLGEPIAWHGPIVMNSQEELRIAFEEYQRGTFVK